MDEAAGVGNPLFVTARVRVGLHTQEEFAEAFEARARTLGLSLGISVRQVQRWESVRPGWPNRAARTVLVELLGATLEDLGFVRPTRPTGRRPLPASDGDPASSQLTVLRDTLDDAARADSLLGPRESLPRVLGILTDLATAARHADQPLRRELLLLGARAAEFAAWLYRDSDAPAEHTAYWHDRAVEFATMGGDGALHGYVLLRKAQAADDDPARMRDLAHAAHAGPWSLPLRPKAEALQQEARALALTGVRGDPIDRLLDQAHEAIVAASPPAGPATCTGPLGDAYTLERLMAQSALCHRESGQAARSVEEFRSCLASATFGPRDRAFFTAALSGALAGANEPDEAALAGLDALAIAAGAGFGRALAELDRTSDLLASHSRRPAVRQLRQALRAARLPAPRTATP
ncbi:XRE family transcriptional regulator [Kitasatospora sp. NBC_01300]|uniref:XRE family transcriptional regulator n=1 Tax=Kitasatospora sp. NBC_01300 TaxID=2903574 RepID=UPI002F90D156|nr:XRE family transcriptional regulator [Kitasatospora sp. NBC_01300]